MRYDEFGKHPHGTPRYAFCVFCDEYEKKDTKHDVRLVRCKSNKIPFMGKHGAGCYSKTKAKEL
jgi:hypothetical protein